MNNTHYKPMSKLEAEQRSKPLSRRSTHADENSEAVPVARLAAKLYLGNDWFMRKMHRKSMHAAWMPSYTQASKILAFAREHQ